MVKMEKKISKSGGITIPSALRRDLGITGKEKVLISVDDSGDIKLKRIAGSCIFCGNYENLVNYEGRYICSECAKKIGGLADVK